MKYIVLSLFALVAVSCQRDNNRPVIQSTVQFSFRHASEDTSSGRVLSTTQPAAVIVSVEDDEGNSIFLQKELTLYAFGEESFLTQPISLTTGEYILTEFFIVNEENEIMYITPIAGSDNAHLVQMPLPIQFNIQQDEVTTISPEVVSPTGTPGSYGYAQFGYEFVNTIQLTVSCFVAGESNFELAEADFLVEGMTDEVIQWSYEGTLTAGTNALNLRKYEEYKITITKEGYKPWDSVVNVVEAPVLDVFLEQEEGFFSLDVEWDKTFGSSESEIAYSVERTSDGGSLLVGTSTGGQNPTQKFYLIKLNINGEEEWSKIFNTTQTYRQGLRGVVESKNNDGYILTGYELDPSLPESPSVTWVGKISLAGDLVWERRFGAPAGGNIGRRIVKSATGYVVAANTIATNTIRLFEIDESGNTLWEKSYSLADCSLATGLVALDDGGYVFTAKGQNSNINTNPSAIVRVDASGNEVWRKLKQHMPSLSFVSEDVIITSEGLFVCGGVGGVLRMYLNGNYKEYNSTPSATRAALLPNDFISIFQNSGNGTNVSSKLTVLNNEMDTIWQADFSRTANDIKVLSGEQLIVIGTTPSNLVPGKGNEAWVVKLQ